MIASFEEIGESRFIQTENGKEVGANKKHGQYKLRGVK